jgi:hypothetical protein
MLPVFFGCETFALLEKVAQVVRFAVADAERDTDDLLIRGGQQLLDLLYTDTGEILDECHRHLLRKDRAEMGGAQSHVGGDGVQRDLGLTVSSPWMYSQARRTIFT